MIITKISPAVKTQGRYNIFVDDQYSFSLDESQLVELKLKRGQEINEEILEKYKNESDFGKNYLRALDLISRRIRSEKEIRDYAWQKQWSPENLERVIERLYQNNYLDDERFAKSFIASRASRAISLKKLRVDLVKKGINKDIIDKALEEDENFSENESLKKVILKKRSHYDDDRKLIAYLMRQGFLYDDINNCLNEIDDI